MTTGLELLNLWPASPGDRVYSPDILPRLQFLLSDLADIDLAYRRNLDAIAHATGDEEAKRIWIARLRRQHEERRSPYLRELASLEDRIDAEMTPP